MPKQKANQKPANPKEIRQARAFLQTRGIRTSDISPLMFANTAKELGKPFYETLKLIAILLTEGQGQGQSVKTKKSLGLL